MFLGILVDSQVYILLESLGSGGFFGNLLDSLEFSGDWNSLMFSGILLGALSFFVVDNLDLPQASIGQKRWKMSRGVR